MHYTGSEISDLIQHLRSYGDTYDYLAEFFGDHLLRISEWGLTDPPSTVVSAAIVHELKYLFPDAFFALTMPEQDLPLYIDQKIGLEYPIAVWRLRTRIKFPTLVGD